MKINILASLLLLSVSCMAGGIETLPLSGAKTVSLNAMYFAGSDGLNRLLNNPAGIIYLQDNGLEFSVLNRLAQNRFESSGNILFRSLRNDEILISGGLYYSFGDNLKIALSYQPASVYNIEWPFAHYFKADTLSSLLVFDYNNRIVSDAISFGTAYRIGMITIGIAPAAYRVKHTLDYPLTYTNWISGTGNAAYQMATDQNGWGFGVNAGILADLSNEMKLGLSIKSSYSADIKGTASTRYFNVGEAADSKSDLSSTVEFPWTFGLGTVYTPNPQWNFNLDVQYSLWGSLKKTLVETFASSEWQNALSSHDALSGITPSNIYLNYKNTVDLGLGIEYVSNEMFSYRFSYRYTQSRNSNDSYSMLFPDVDQHWLNIGFGLNEEFIKLDGAIAWGIGVSNDLQKEGNNMPGKYGYSAVVPTLTIKYLIK